MNIVIFSKNLFLFFLCTYKNRFDIFSIYKFDFPYYHKTDLIFLSPKNQVFLVLKNRSDIFFLKPKDFNLFNKHRFEFFSPKIIFSTHKKKNLIFLNQNQFLSQHKSEFFNKEEHAFINRLMWFSFSCVQHIIHVMDKKGYIGHENLEN